MVNKALKIAADEIAVILQRLSVNGAAQVDTWMLDNVLYTKVHVIDDVGEYSEYAIGSSDDD